MKTTFKDPGVIEQSTIFIKKWTVFLFMFFLVFACSKEEDPLMKPVILKHVIIQYNKLLADGYRKMNMNDLLTVATKERAMKVYYHMSALGEARIKMDSNMEKIEFKEIKFISPAKAEVRTEEHWDYKHINIDTKETVLSRSVNYEMKYTLTRYEDRWLVSDAEIIKKDEESTSGS